MTNSDQIVFEGHAGRLVADAMGPEDGPVVLFLHGSGQTRGSWGKALPVAAARGVRAITMDQRGHGDSDWDKEGRYGLTDFADDLKAVVSQIGRPPILVGASLGGLVGLLAAAEDPDLLAGLVLVDITTKVEMEGAQEVMDFMGSAQDGFASLEEAADAVAAYLPHRPRPKDTRGLARNLRLKEDGRYHWHWDPAFHDYGVKASERMENVDRLDDAARKLTLPVLLVRGGRSNIVSEEGAKAFLELVPHTEYVDIAGAHHMVAGDANDAFNDAVFDFVAKLT